jgi:hypothetical protein
MVPWDASKCHKDDKQEAFTELCICSYIDMLRDQSIPGSCTSPPQQCVPKKICQKATPSLIPNSPPQEKGPNLKKKKTFVNDKRATNFLGSLSISKGNFSFLSNKSYLCADFVIL